MGPEGALGPRQAPDQSEGFQVHVRKKDPETKWGKDLAIQLWPWGVSIFQQQYGKMKRRGGKLMVAERKDRLKT